MDSNYPEMVLAVCALIRGAVERVRREHLEVRPSRGFLTLQPEGDVLHVPVFSYLNGELLSAAATCGVLDRRVEAYLDSFIGFASGYLKDLDLVAPLVSSGSYRTTEDEVLESFPTRGAFLTQDRGLSLVRESCRRLDEQVTTLCRRRDETPPGHGGVGREANVVSIRDSPAVTAGGKT